MKKINPEEITNGNVPELSELTENINDVVENADAEFADDADMSINKPAEQYDHSQVKIDDNTAICPECGKSLDKLDHYCYYHWNDDEWSDLRHIAPDVMVPSIVQHCPHCGKYFAQGKTHVLINDVNTVNFVDPVIYPALKDGFASYDSLDWDDTQEFNQRLRFMWAYNDYFHRSNASQVGPSPEDKANFLHNVECLKRHVHPIYYADFLRQAGEYDRCIALLNAPETDKPEEAMPFVNAILDLARQGMSAPINFGKQDDSSEV